MLDIYNQKLVAVSKAINRSEGVTKETIIYGYFGKDPKNSTMIELQNVENETNGDNILRFYKDKIGLTYSEIMSLKEEIKKVI